MRGKPFHSSRSMFAPGLIPAHAGKTLGIIAIGYQPPAHPRACGENTYVGKVRKQPRGSSPRMRGKLSSCIDDSPIRGLIPAHAGKTRPPRSSVSRQGAHPRACGENGRVTRSESCISGSSPRMRGKRNPYSRRPKQSGLIPAHAGKTIVISYATSKSRAHPRACGENLPSTIGPTMKTGSSPRMRGKQNILNLSKAFSGLIPAHAGKTGHAGN